MAYCLQPIHGHIGTERVEEQRTSGYEQSIDSLIPRQQINTSQNRKIGSYPRLQRKEKESVRTTWGPSLLVTNLPQNIPPISTLQPIHLRSHLSHLILTLLFVSNTALGLVAHRSQSHSHYHNVKMSTGTITLTSSDEVDITLGTSTLETIPVLYIARCKLTLHRPRRC